jgi:hypothetical protein
MKDAELHPCPICSAPNPHQARYPNSVCFDCYDKACDSQGRKLNFFNLSMSGGFVAVIADTDEIYPSHICFIDGVACWADEARFGGIVIEPLQQ